MSDARTGSRGPLDASPKRVLLFATGRDYALLSPSIRDDATILVWGPSSSERSLPELRTYLGNSHLFPEGRPRVLSLVGDFSKELRDAFAGIAQKRGFGVQIEHDSIALAAERGPATVVWYSRPGYMPLAQFWAHRAETLSGTPHTVVGSAEDYQRLESLHAVADSVVDFGGTFAVKPSWSVVGPDGSTTPPVSGGPPQGQARVFPSSRDIDEEVLQMHQAVRAWDRAQRLTPEGQMNFGPPDPDDYSTVDVVLYTDYGQSSFVGLEPLSFYDSTDVADSYSSATGCAGVSPGYCRENAVPRLVEFKLEDSFTNRCDDTFYGAKMGWDCAYLSNGLEDNAVDLAVISRVNSILTALKGSPTYYTIGNVVIVAHWMDIPYREKLYPYNPDYNHLKHFRHGTGYGPPFVLDADYLFMDSDNDLDPCSEQNYASGVPAISACSVNENEWHTSYTPRDPDASDDQFEGDTGSLDYYLADFHDDDSASPYAYAHAGFGRIAGHDTTQVGFLINTANYLLSGGLVPDDGTTAVYGGPGAEADGVRQDYDAIMECRYGDSSSLIKRPCRESGVTCPNDEEDPDPITYDEKDHFYDTADDYGEIVVADGHSISASFTDWQWTQFFGGGQPPIIDSRSLQEWLNDPFAERDLQPGIWTIYGSNVFGYAYLNPVEDPKRCEGTDCYTEPGHYCNSTCLDDFEESSFVSTLVPGGVAAIRGSFASHGYGVTIGNIGATSFLREIAASVPYGKAHRIAINEARFKWYQEKEYDPDVIFEVSTQLVGDPLLKLPAAMSAGCANAPAFIAGKGPSDVSQQGTPWVRGMRKDGIPMNGVLDFRPFIPGSQGGGTFLYGNTVAAGNLRAASPDTTDEIAVGKGPSGSADSLVKVFDYDGTMRGYFYAFSTDGEYGVNVAVGDVINDTGTQDIVVGRGPGSTFAPSFRVFYYSFGSWTGNTSVDAYSSGTYGVNVATGDITSTDLDEVVTGKGPGSSYASSVRVWNGSPSTPTEYTGLRIDAFGSSGTWGVNVGTGDFENDGNLELIAGKGPGDVSGGSGMDHELRLFKWGGISWTQKLSLSDPFGLGSSFSSLPGLKAGARGIGYEGDGSSGDELLAAIGPIIETSTGPWDDPANLRGSRVVGFNVATANPWSASTLLDDVVYEEHEYPGNDAIRGLTIARFNSVGLSNPLSMQEDRGVESEPKGESRPVWPDRNGAAIAAEFNAVLEDAAEGLFRDREAKDYLIAEVTGVAEDLRQGRTGEAITRVEALEQFIGSGVRNDWTREDLSTLLGMLASSIVQQVGNRPPVPVLAPPQHDLTVRSGDTVRVVLDASRSTDADSTPATNDNIVRYRWYDDATGTLVATGSQVTVQVSHDGSEGPTSHTFVVELEDAYGGKSYGSTEITLTPEDQRR